MKRRAFILVFVILSVSAGIAGANPFSDDVKTQLTQQGFSGITSEITWLGRVRIVAQRKDGQREIVLNPRTGEILRDAWTSTDGAASTGPIVDNVGQSSRSSGGEASGSSQGSDNDSASGSDAAADAGGKASSSSGSGNGAASGSSSGSGSGSGTGGGSGSGGGSDYGGDHDGSGKGHDK